MLVHNLPGHLLDVVNKKHMEDVDAADKYVLIVEEDRLYKPNKLSPIGTVLNDLANRIDSLGSPPYSN
jgi:hypothetical protein